MTGASGNARPLWIVSGTIIYCEWFFICVVRYIILRQYTYIVFFGKIQYIIRWIFYILLCIIPKELYYLVVIPSSIYSLYPFVLLGLRVMCLTTCIVLESMKSIWVCANCQSSLSRESLCIYYSYLIRNGLYLWRTPCLLESVR